MTTKKNARTTAANPPAAKQSSSANDNADAVPSNAQKDPDTWVTGDESMTGERGLELYWVIDDAEAAFRALSQKAAVSLPLSEMPFGKVFGLTDPAGQLRYLVEFAKNRPSQPA